jgi:hypothetical protein
LNANSTAVSNETARAEAAEAALQAAMVSSGSDFSSHVNDMTVHLTAAQNTLLDGLNATLTAADLNNTPTVASNLTALTSTVNTHISDGSLHLTAAQNTYLDGLTLPTLSSSDTQRSAGLAAYLDSAYSSDTTLLTALSTLNSDKVSKTGDTMTGTLTMSGGAKITGLPTPTGSSDAVNKAYVDAYVNGMQWALSVKAATVGNITRSGLQTIDDVSLVAGDRLLVKDQTTTAENGIYIVSTGTWSRASDYATTADINNSAVYVLSGGTVNGNSTWIQTATVTNVNTDPITFTANSGAVVTAAGNGISLSVNGVVSVNEGAGLKFSGSTLVADLFSSGGLITTIDGSTTSNATGAQLALSNTGVTSGTYGSSTTTPVLVIDTKGRVSSASNVTITPDWSNVTNRPTTIYALQGSQDSLTADPINRVNSGFYEQSTTTTANGWPVNGSWWHLFSTTHANTANYYAMQFAANFYGNDLRYRSTNNSGSTAWSTVLLSTNFNAYAPTLTGTGASGTWGIDISGTATTATNQSGGTVSATTLSAGSGNFVVNSNGVIATIQGQSPTNGAIRLTPNLHLNPGNGSAVIVAWDNGNGGNSSNLAFRIGNGSGTDVLTVNYSGNLITAGTVTAYSDRRLKTDISTIQDALEKVKALNGVMFTRIDTQERGTGLIAQDVQTVMPEAVNEGLDGKLSVAYGNLIGLLVEAVKELDRKVDALSTNAAPKL